MKTMTRPTDERTDAVRGLFDALVVFSQALRARGSTWNSVVQDLTRGDVVTLGVLDARGTSRPGQIATALAVDPSVVSRQLVGLHRLGLVTRAPDPLDGRAELIEITDAGRDRLRDARTAICQVLAERLDQWELHDLTRATAMVSELAERLHEPVPTTRPEDDPTR